MRRDLFVVSLLVLFLVLSLGQLGFFDLARLSRGASNLVLFSRETVPPDLGILPMAGQALVETVEMAMAGTILGFFFSLPLGFLGTRSFFPATFVVLPRLIIAATRTIPSLLWAILFVIIVGLGPLAGTLGLAVYTVGYLAKLYYEFFEGVDPEVVEAVMGVGASKLQLARFVVWPETANSILSQLMFMLEYNIRASSILGLVGAGGIGFYMQVYIQTLEYQRLTTLLLLILVLVIFMDYFSAWVRNHYLLVR
ncbi:MAG: phosphonate ABC transporter, permease protein PhnE [Chloroflexi bacterium]|nr:phosphonate ABC transporter, permease protein PhnE [Chloroflexota bacterium]